MEDLPADAWVFRRVHNTFHSKTTPRMPNPGAFKDPGGELSVDWSKYSTAKLTRHGGPKPAHEYAVVALHLGEIPLQELGLTAVHAPVQQAGGNAKANRAHCLIKGNLTPEVRDILLEKAQLIIPVESPEDFDPPNPA